METIAVTKDQAKALLAEAKKRAKKTKVDGGYQKYFKHVRGAVPSVTDNKTSCADHRLVRVVCGLRERAGIKHKSRGNVLFAPGTKLARKHPRGVACFMKWTTPVAPRSSARVLHRRDVGEHKRLMYPMRRSFAIRGGQTLAEWTAERNGDGGGVPISAEDARLQWTQEIEDHATTQYQQARLGNAHNYLQQARIPRVYQ
jgi:hypothetical protein